MDQQRLEKKIKDIDKNIPNTTQKLQRLKTSMSSITILLDNLTVKVTFSIKAADVEKKFNYQGCCQYQRD